MTRTALRTISALFCAALLAGATTVGATASGTPDPAASLETPASPQQLLANGGVVAAYTLIVPRSAAPSQLQARAVIPTGVDCPRLHITTTAGRNLVRDMGMRVPGATTGAAFANVRACEGNLPANAARAKVGTTRVPASLPGRVTELAIIGDTGCRMKGSSIQDCANDWPLAENARSIARTDPDAIIMVGDFFYREAACPTADQALCGGSPPPLNGMPFKDSQYGWMADAFIPMAPLFAAAPILVVRGNHEECSRGGNGYFLFFDASPLGPDACAPVGGVAPTNITPSWAVDLPTSGRTLRLVVVDAAYGEDSSVTSWVTQQEPEYQRAWRMARRGRGSPDVWLLMHRPIFGLLTTDYSTGPTWTPWMSMDQQAAAEGLLGPYQAIMSGHLHLAQAVRTPGYPAQFVVGTGGTTLDPPTGYAIPPYGPLLDGTGQPVSPFFAPYPNATYQWTSVQFGYVVATPGMPAARWSFAFRSPAGDDFAQCALLGRSVTCS